MLLVVLFCGNGLATDSITLEAGETTLISVAGKTDASYYIFVPSSYSHTNWGVPLIYAFSPGGDGKAILKQIRPACSGRGWLLVGCNKLRNGFNPTNHLMEREIILDVRKRVPHDLTREYLAGFSGGGMRAYGMARYFWDEFAGVIAYCGWLGVYEQEFVYPSRLAVAMINGNRDHAALRQGKVDRDILHRFGIRTAEFQFDGGHGLGPPSITGQALQWLEEDWKQNQMGKTARADQESALCLGKMRTALMKKKLVEAAESASRIVLDYAFTPSASEADEVLTKIFACPANRSKAIKGLPFLTNTTTAEIFLARVRDSSGFPPEQRIGHCELAWALNPNRAEAAAQLAAAWADNPEARPTDLQRAEELAAFSTDKDSANWHGWHVRGMVATRRKHESEAREYWQKAIDVSPSWARAYCESHLKNLSP